MRRVSGCFICRQDHLAGQLQRRDEITAAIFRWKSKHCTAFLTDKNLFVIYGMVDLHGDVKAAEAADRTWWAENDSTEDGYIALIALVEGELIEKHFALVALLHESDVRQKEKTHVICKRIDHSDGPKERIENYNPFNGPRNCNSVNRITVVTVVKYHIFS